MYYLCSGNKGSDQLRGHREADMRLCFRICKKPAFSLRGSFDGAVKTLLSFDDDEIFHGNYLMDGNLYDELKFIILLFSVSV